MRKSGVLSALCGAAIFVAGSAVTGDAATVQSGHSISSSSTKSVPQSPTRSIPHAAPVTNGAWTVYHRDDGHTGFDSTTPTASGATTGWVSAILDQNVYAEPLVYQGIVYVATLNNTVYALNQQDGTTIWSKNLGAPTSSGWLCGNVSPQGILGTPVIDTAANRIYVAALLSTHVYYVFGLDLANLGNVVLQTAIPTYGGVFDWKIQQERGALALRNGYVYVPMGGRDGDCNDGSTLYQGWIYAVPTSGAGGSSVLHWNSGGAGGQSVWAAGGVAVDDSTGSVIFATGQGNCPSQSSYDYNNAVMKLSATLALQDYFAPFDWHNYACTDNDLGSASPVLISPTLLFQAGKPGQGYLVNPQSMGGVDGQVYPAKNTNVPVCLGNSGAANYGAYAYAAPYVYLECEGSGITGLKINTSAPNFSNCDATCGSPSWNNGTGTFGAPIVAGGIVWAVNTDGSGLWGFDPVTGGVVFQSASFSTRRFVTPTEAGGQIFVPASNVIREFNMTPSCTNAGLATSPNSPQPTNTPVTLTGSITNCANPLYRFWVRPPGGAWGIVQDFSPTATFNWTTDNQIGVYNLEVDVKDASSTAAYDSVHNITYTITGLCTTALITPRPASPQTAGSQVVWTGSSTGCANPRYRFWELDPGRRWSMVQDYSATTTYTWHSPGITGNYEFEVDVRDASESTVYDVVNDQPYVLQTAAACTNAGLAVSPVSPGATGSSVTMTGSSSSCPNPRYRFWVSDPGSRWSMVQDYSAANTHVWSQTFAPGVYRMEVDVRDASETVAYDVVKNITYTLVGCTGATLMASPTTAAHGAGTITLTATATCPGTPQYRFWVEDPGNRWSMVQDFSSNNTYTWPKANQPVSGVYHIEVDVRDQGSTAVYEYATSGYTYTMS